MAKVITTINPFANRVVIIPGLYSGASSVRKTVPPMMPPIPPAPTLSAEVSARFHCPRMLFACHASVEGRFAEPAAVVRKAPMRRLAVGVVKPRRERPTCFYG
jgi:hypothetical protein